MTLNQKWKALTEQANKLSVSEYAGANAYLSGAGVRERVF